MKKLARWQDNQFILEDEWQQPGKTIEYKEVLSEITPKSFVLTSYIGEEGAPLKKSITYRATRAAPDP